VCVIGAGVIGLSSACRVQDELPDVDVTVISDEFSPNTTGDGAAGFWRPYYVEGTPDKLIWKWGKDTFEHLYSLSMTAEGGTLGIFQCSGYDIYWNNQQEAFWKDIVFGYRSMTAAELGQFGDRYRCGYAYTTMMCECKTYLPWLLKRFTSKGGKCMQRKVEKLTDLVGKYDVIVNCPGAWARHVNNDLQVEPLKGQLIKVAAPWVKHFVNAGDDDDLYILVGTGSVALGGTHEKGDWSRTIDPVHRKRIWEGCCRLIPSLEKAEVVEEWAGLRPSRPSICLEKEQLVVGNDTLKVVHNYGHGGSGVTLHWGCAGEAARLVKELLDPVSSASQL
jgi:glycine/D-amino acid oxidase-like deaminating enzyme